MKKLKRNLQILVFSLVLILGCKVYVQAAGTSIQFSDPKAQRGEKVSVTVKVESTSDALGAIDLDIVYDDEALEFESGGSAVQGGSGSIRIADTASDAETKTMAYELTFTALKAGETSISVSNYEVVNFDESVATVSHVGSAKVQVTDEEVTLSRDASLKQLKISNGTLSPAFSPSIMKYTANVSADVSSVVVSGTTTNAKAEITSITGADSLKDGENTIKVSVTAESGATAIYTITVTKEASTSEVIEETTETTVTPKPEEDENVTPEPTEEPTGEVEPAGFTVEVNEKILTPVSLPENAELKGYKTGSLEYNGESIEALVSEYMELYVINMADAQGNEDYYVYYKDIDKFTEFVKIDNGDGKFIVVLDEYPRDISVYGFERTPIIINNKKINIGWKYTEELIAYSNAAAEYYLVGGLSDSGVNTWYVYDFVEKTYQRYFVQPANLIEEESGPDLTLTEQEQQVKELNDALQKVKSDRLTIIVIIAAIAVILLIATINLCLKIHILKEDIADLEEELEEANGGVNIIKKAEEPVERRQVKRERVVKPRAPRQDRNRVNTQNNIEDNDGNEEFAEEVYQKPQMLVKEEQKKAEVKNKVTKRKLAEVDSEFFDEDDHIPSEIEDEIIRAKMHESEQEENFEAEEEKEETPVIRKKLVKPEKVEKTVKPEKTVKTAKTVKPEKLVKTEKTVKPEKTVKTEKTAKPVKREKAVKTVKQEKATKLKRPPKTSEEIEKDFKAEDFDFEFINLDDE